jgi:hypothetical protein
MVGRCRICCSILILCPEIEVQDRNPPINDNPNSNNVVKRMLRPFSYMDPETILERNGGQ